MKGGKAGVLVFIVAAVMLGVVSGVSSAPPDPPEPRSHRQIRAVLAKAPKAPAGRKLRTINIVLVYSKKDHGLHEHDYPLWAKRWKVLLAGGKGGQAGQSQVNLYGPAAEGKAAGVIAGAENVRVSTVFEWPGAEDFQKADLIVKFGRGNWDQQRIDDLKQYLGRGRGFVAVHPCVIADKAMALIAAEQIGLAWEQGYTRFRHGAMDLKIIAPDHPICLGLPKTIHLLDEAYWPLKGDLGRIKVLATSDETVSRGSQQKKPEPMFYTREHGRGRVFSCIPGHYTWTFDDPYFRILLLRGMAWAAGESPYRFDPLVLTGCANRDVGDSASKP